MKKIGNIVRYSIGILFIIGMLGITPDSILAGVFMGLFGVSLLPVVYDNLIYNRFKIDKSSYLHIIIPILLFFTMCVFMPETEVETNIDNIVNNNVIKEDDKAEGNEIMEENSIKNEITEDNTEGTTTKEENKQEEPKKKTTNTKPSAVTPIQQPNNVSENKENENKQETTKPSTPASILETESEPIPEPESETTPNPTPTPESESEITQPDTIQNSRTVYRTPSGKRYHLDPDCGGKNSRPTTLDEATSLGLTPCQKCAK